MFQYSNGHSLGADIAIGLGKTFEKNCVLTRNVFFSYLLGWLAEIGLIIEFNSMHFPQVTMINCKDRFWCWGLICILKVTTVLGVVTTVAILNHYKNEIKSDGERTSSLELEVVTLLFI